MRKSACFLLILFVGFLATPTIITYIDNSVDVTIAFSANEEENSLSTQIGVEYTFFEHDPAAINLHFSHSMAALNHTYKDGQQLIFQEVLSPPPKFLVII